MPLDPASLIAALAGAVAGLALQLRLRPLPHRRADEQHLPHPATWWLVPVAAIASGLVWQAISPDRPVLVPAVYVLATWVMTALAFIDLDVHRLPDRIQLPAFPALLLLLAACALAGEGWTPFVRACLAGVTLFVVYFVMALLPGGGIGFGDVKLAGLLGMLLGWLSWTHVLHATLATFLLGGVIGLALLLTRRKGARDELAYGPPMILGAVGVITWPAVTTLLGG